MHTFKRKSTTESQSHREKLDFSFNVFLCASVSLWWVFPLLLVVASFAHAEERITFRDVTAQAGIHFTHNNGAFGKKWLPETMGPGCAFIDYDNDGFPDTTAFPTSCSSTARTGQATPKTARPP